MKHKTLSTIEKALSINLDSNIYGSFAEIGAGQEVARCFFRAGGAAGTVAKTMSAYDMKFSDDIYGKEESGRYVVESRLNKMLGHEFDLLVERLSDTRGSDTRFFAFADTVSALNYQGTNECHGWLGVRFQTEPGEPCNQVILHVHMHDNNNMQQQEAIGILGVNLIHSCFYHIKDSDEFISTITENLSRQRIEIDMIHSEGPSLQHLDNRVLSLKLIEQGFTDAVLFGCDGEVKQPSEIFYKKPLLLQRGSFRPFTKVNLDILKHGSEQFVKDYAEIKSGEDIVIVNEITMQNLKGDSEQTSIKDFLERVESLSSLGHNILISNYTLFVDIKSYLNRFTKAPIAMVVGAGHLEKIFDEDFYSHLEGGILEAFGKLANGDSSLYVYPLHTAESCQTSQTFFPPEHLQSLYSYLKSNRKIVDLLGCDSTEVSVHSSGVRQMLRDNDPQWEKLVPTEVATVIKDKGLFGYKN